MEVLPDIVGREPVVVFCGLAGAESTKTREHFYESPGNSFWESLHLSGLSPRRLAPEEDRLVPELGFGLTDLVGHWDPRWVEIDELVAKTERWRPEWLAFTSKGVAFEASRALGRRGRPGLGVQDWYVGPAQVFVLPGTSGANQRRDYDGRPNRLSWWRDLAGLAGR
ncbi:MAG TPA: mismatch-specific DNA-glycosylase [Nocardioides sp.]|uniref:mismatch-specific DNA-glycosylase n=1 Tax=Nocardioides sp. TaxID=35761 RepID=UPI002C7C84B4|nr:mismatch-specific DNA-glycosylase [Nocardioides sp.]HTW14307.1 mismatch-specific DNA-glycosylase [Nocardioides sp.]